MADIPQLLAQISSVLLAFISQPFYYVGLLIVILLYRRQIRMERKLFHTRLHSLSGETWRSLLWGLIGGLAVSLLMALVGVTLTSASIILIWVLSLILLLIRVRFICFAYVIGLFGILHFIAATFPGLWSGEKFGWLERALLQPHMPSLFILIGLLHLLEAILVRRHNARTAMPLHVDGKRGHIVGGYQMQGYWSVALFLVVPVQTGGSIVSWSPLWGGNLWADGWSILVLPAMIGFAEITLSRLPREKVSRSSAMLTGFGVIMLLAGAAAEWFPVLTLAVSILCIAGHEAISFYSRWEETKRSPSYVHDNRGLMILAVVPSSPAAEMGVVAGEIIHKVNGNRVHTKADLHQNLRLNSAFCKLEVINLEGQSKFLQRAMFADEHHQLGILLAPDEDAPYTASAGQFGILPYLRSQLGLIQHRGREMK